MPGSESVFVGRSEATHLGREIRSRIFHILNASNFHFILYVVAMPPLQVVYRFGIGAINVCVICEVKIAVSVFFMYRSTDYNINVSHSVFIL